mmetsp:Transcript_118485/g.382523  ORF Transcript_118485/g.382523 Transcript_118485/m.382523 type:complete len:218 (-) Transcript_118485:594-1247(-)
MPARKVSTGMYSSCSWSRMGHFFMGEKPNAGMPRCRRKRESVAAGKTSGSALWPMPARASVKATHQGFESSAAVTKCSFRGRDQGANCHVTPSSPSHQRFSRASKSFGFRDGGIRTSKPASASVGMTLRHQVLPPSHETPVRSIVRFTVVTSPSFLAAPCLQPCASWPSSASCCLRYSSARSAMRRSFWGAVSLMKREPWPVGPVARTMIHHGVRSP